VGNVLRPTPTYLNESFRRGKLKAERRGLLSPYLPRVYKMKYLCLPLFLFSTRLIELVDRLFGVLESPCRKHGHHVHRGLLPVAEFSRQLRKHTGSPPRRASTRSAGQCVGFLSDVSHANRHLLYVVCKDCLLDNPNWLVGTGVALDTTALQ